MLRRQFLAGAIAVTSVAFLPAAASAKRGGGFKFFSRNDSPATRTTKIWIFGTGGALLGLIAIARGVFWVLNRLEQNPGRTTAYAPPPEVPVQRTAAAPVAVRRTASGPSFGRRS